VSIGYFNPLFTLKEKSSMRRLVLASLIIAALIVSACGGSTPPPTATPAPAAPAEQPTATPVSAQPIPGEAVAAPTAAPAPEVAEATVVDGNIVLPLVNPLEVTGDIIVAGSSTVFPLTERMAERFRDEGYAGNITIDSIGSGAGFERFCVAGETDISNASRAIKASEIESCSSPSAAPPVEFRVGTDALAVVVNPNNDWIGEEGVTLAKSWPSFSLATTTNWSDVNPAWPAQPVKRFSPGTDSGTFDYFIEAVMDPVFPDAGEEALLARLPACSSPKMTTSSSRVSRATPTPSATFGFAYFEENAAKLRDLAIEGVAPNADYRQRWRLPVGPPALHLL
jgi:phosphate transport system substrate-binding protein